MGDGDFTREELADFRQTVEAVRDEAPWSQQDRDRLLARFGGESEALLRLLSMAERAVTVATLRKLREWDDAEGSAEDGDARWQAFTAGAYTDLRAAATSLKETT